MEISFTNLSLLIMKCFLNPNSEDLRSIDIILNSMDLSNNIDPKLIDLIETFNIWREKTSKIIDRKNKYAVSCAVIDEFKNYEIEHIKQYLHDHSLPYAACMAQLEGDFNISTLVRNANAFQAKEVYYYGKKRWDKRGAIGTYNYTPVNWLDDIQNIENLRKKYNRFVAIDILPGVSKNIFEHEWQEGTLMFFGEESKGLGEEILGICDHILHIPQGGSVRSINVGTASGIAFSDFRQRYKNDK